MDIQNLKYYFLINPYDEIRTNTEAIKINNFMKFENLSLINISKNKKVDFLSKLMIKKIVNSNTIIVNL